MAAPTGTVTLLFTDIVGSTKLWETEPGAMSAALRRHDQILREAITSADGFVFKTVGDAFCAAFPTAAGGLAAAVTAQRALAAEKWPEPVALRARMALHTGVCEEREGDYFGPVVNRAARLEATAHGGQVVVSGTTAELVKDTLSEGLVLKDLGRHRLKDLGTPEAIFQLVAADLASDFPPLRSLDNPDLKNNLPVQVSSFVGRDAEVIQVRSLIDQSRLITLTGSGGCGKSRLALQVAADEVDGSADGVWLVELAPVGSPDLVAATVATALSVREEPGRSLTDTLIDSLSERRLLIVLDNCEHLIGTCAKLVDALLRSCPKVVVLATSREPLGIDGEHVFRIPSLSLPPLGAGNAGTNDAARSEAVALFVERASAHRPRVLSFRGQRSRPGVGLPSPRRHPPGHRVGRRTHALAYRERDRRTVRQPPAPAHRREPHGTPPASDPAGTDRLVL